MSNIDNEQKWLGIWNITYKITIIKKPIKHDRILISLIIKSIDITYSTCFRSREMHK